jgi:hypothetical protein
LILTSFLSILIVGQTPTPERAAPRLSRAETVRCAGLSQAAAELEGGESGEGRALSDAALFWSLAAAQSAAIQGLGEAESDRELTVARLRAVRELARGDADARAALAACRARVPDLG